MDSPRILLIEDDESGRELATENLRGAGYEVDPAPTARAGLESFDPARHELVVTDLRLPDHHGLEVLATVKRLSAKTPVIVMTAYTSIDVAVDAMKAGAFDFMGKPFGRDQLLLTVKRALDFARLEREAAALRVQASGVEMPLILRSDAMRAAVELADRCAHAEAPVLVLGEPGSGKEVLARRIHVRSTRAQGPFICVRCAALPKNELRRELFGAESRLLEAVQGSLFLDELTALSLDDQRELVARIDDSPREASPRLLASTVWDPAEAVERGELLDELRRRIAVVSIRVPPLRERVDDVVPLAEFFVSQFSEGRGLSFEAGLLRELEDRDWPGNARELRNACERLVVLCPGSQLRASDLPRGPAAAVATEPSEEWPPLPAGGLSLIDLERRVIERVLELKGGNVTQAAVYLGVPRHFLAYRIQKYGIR